MFWTSWQSSLNSTFAIFPFVKMIDQLNKLVLLYSLYLPNCSLTNLPELKDIPNLYNVDLSNNPLSQIAGFNNVFYLLPDNTLFTEILTLTNPERLGKLSMSNNSLKNVAKIGSFINLRSLDFNNSTLSSIPPTIDRLQKLGRLSLNHNKLFLSSNERSQHSQYDIRWHLQQCISAYGTWSNSQPVSTFTTQHHTCHMKEH